MKTLPPGKLFDATFSRSHYFTTVANDVTLEEIMTPGFWRDHQPSMKVNTVIEIVRADGTLDLTARVIQSVPGMVKLRPLFPPINDERNIKASRRAAAKDAAEGEADETNEVPDGYKVKYTPASGYFVLLTGANGTVSNLTQGQKDLSKPDAIKIAIAHHKQATTPVNA
jgi:hypothetical protein